MTGTIGDLARAAFDADVAELVRQDAALRIGASEEAVHEARVAVRRLRSDLRTFRPVLDAAWANDLRERMRWLQDGFSAARDADVLLARLRGDAVHLPEREREQLDAVLQPLLGAREAAYGRVRAMLREPRYATLLQELIDAARQPPLSGRAASSAEACIATLLRGGWKKLRRCVRERSRPPADRELHRIRIAAKRVRYAAEAFVPVAGARARALAHAAQAVQTILGDQHDAVVAQERLRELPHDARRAFVAGELAALEHCAAQAGRRAWRAAWKRAQRAYRRLVR